jgi:hypothetical protein
MLWCPCIVCSASQYVVKECSAQHQLSGTWFCVVNIPTHIRFLWETKDLRKTINGGNEMRGFGWDHKNLTLCEENP